MIRLPLEILIFSLTSFQIESAPPILWTLEYGGTFYNVTERDDGTYLVAGHRYTPIDDQEYCLFSFSEDGTHLWSKGVAEYQGGQIGRWVCELGNQNIIVAGTCAISDTCSTSAVMLTETDSTGDVIWTKAYDLTDKNDVVNCVYPLDDGGFALAGYSDVWGEPSQTVVMRTDSQGDTLWTFTSSESFSNEGIRVLQIDDGLLVFSSGTEYWGGSIRLLLFSDSDGSLLWEYDDFPDYLTSGHLGGDLCKSGSSNGYALVSSYWPQIAHVDSLGNLLWCYEIPASTQPFGHSINPTMDGGFIYGGENRPDPDIPSSQQKGEIVKYDAEGNIMWGYYLSNVNSVRSVRQLRSGGYIACGPIGMLLRIGSETGIEGSDPAPVELTSLSPNPFSESISINFSLFEASETSLEVYDLSGRQIEQVFSELLPSGNHTAVWTPSGQPAGCYIVKLSTAEHTAAQTCVLLE